MYFPRWNLVCFDPSSPYCVSVSHFWDDSVFAVLLFVGSTQYVVGFLVL